MKVLLLLLSFASSAMAEPAPVCPEYSAPHCTAGERLDVTKDEKGCNVAACVTAESMAVEDAVENSCPAFEPIACGKLENPSSKLDENGCKIATCEKLPE